MTFDELREFDELMYSISVNLKERFSIALLFFNKTENLRDKMCMFRLKDASIPEVYILHIWKKDGSYTVDLSSRSHYEHIKLLGEDTPSACTYQITDAIDKYYERM